MAGNYEDEVLQNLGERLASTDSPFTWMPDRSEFQATDPLFLLDKNNPNDDDGHKFKTYSQYLLRIFELKNKNDIANALQNMDKWEAFVANKTSMDDFTIKNSTALKHVLYSSKAHLLLKMGQYEKVKALIELIDGIEIKHDHLRAAKLGLKAMFFSQYGSKGYERALPIIQEALKLDPDEPEWVYLTAKIMRRIRRGEMKNVEETAESRFEEVRLFEKLLTLEEKGIYFIHLGNAYIDLAHYLEFKNKINEHRCFCQCNNCDEVWKYRDNGISCFQKGLIMDPMKENYLSVFGGIMSLRYNIINKYQSTVDTWHSQFFQRGFAEGDDTAVCYVLGKYYRRVKIPDKCMYYMSKAAKLGNLSAKRELIRMRFDRTSKFYNPYDNPEKEIFEIINTYPDRLKKIEFLSQLSSYYLFIKNDLIKVKDLILQVEKEDPEFVSTYLRKQRSWFYQPFRLIDLLREVNERVSARLEELEGGDGSKEAQELRDFQKKIKKAL